MVGRPNPRCPPNQAAGVVSTLFTNLNIILKPHSTFPNILTTNLLTSLLESTLVTIALPVESPSKAASKQALSHAPVSIPCTGSLWCKTAWPPGASLNYVML